MSSSLWQSSFIAQSTIVIDHPLQSSGSKSQNNAISTKIETSQNTKEENDFADPLNVNNFSNDLNINSTNGTKSSNNILDGPLSNTLLDNLTLDSNDNDPELIGFRHWREFRSLIQENFHSKDLLNIETSFIKTSTTKHIVRKKR